ncbi:MAG: hypothetical protein ACOVS5_07405 [Oligoflexus sp.]
MRTIKPSEAAPAAPEKDKPSPSQSADTVPLAKVSPAKVSPSSSVSNLSRHAPEEEENMTEEARLSEILPQAGAIEVKKPKKRGGLFWRKSEEEDEKEHEDHEEAPHEAMSEVWNLSHSARQDDEDEEKSSDIAQTPRAKGHSRTEEDDDGDTWAEPARSPKKSKMLDPDEDDDHAVSETWGIHEKTVKTGVNSQSLPKDDEHEGEQGSPSWPLDEQTVKTGSPKTKGQTSDRGEEEPDNWDIGPPEPTQARGQNSLLNETRPQRLIRPAKGGAAPASALPVSVPVTEDGWNLGPSPHTDRDDNDDDNDDDIDDDIDDDDEKGR